MMPELRARERLLPSFLMEAWEGLVGLEEGLEGLESPAAKAARDSLVVLSHRLHGSASLYGFSRLSQLAGQLEKLARQVLEPSSTQSSVRQLFADMLTILPGILESIAARGQEQLPAELAELDRRFGEISRSQEEIPAPAGEPVEQALRRFAREDPAALAFFLPEVEEHLQGAQQSLELLEAQRDDGEALRRLFRQVHTLKGAAFTVGIQPMGDLAHQIEDLLAGARKGTAVISGKALQAIAAGIDSQRLMLEVVRGGSCEVQATYDEALKALTSLPPNAVQDRSDAAQLATGQEIESAGDPAAPGSLAVRPVQHGGRVAATIRVPLDRMDSLLDMAGELVIARSRLDRHLGGLEKLGEQLLSSRDRMSLTVSDFEARHLNPALDRRDAVDDSLESRPDPTGLGTAAELFEELEFDRYDDFNILARQIGELASDFSQVQAELQTLIGVLRDDGHALQKLTRDLRTGIGGTRMVPIGQLFARFTRLTRKAAQEAGKLVFLEFAGEAVEIDSAVVERLADPLMHLVQNAISHGIEAPPERQARGKQRQGNLTLSAAPHGNFIRIEVKDDGAGIDVEQLKAVAEEQGFLSSQAAAALSSDEALKLIFLPGLSTSRQVTTAAGRGVGMDVVRAHIEQLHGEISIETTVGHGTRFTLELPLTLLVTEALRVRVGDQMFGIPVPAVRQMIHLHGADIETTEAGARLMFEDERLEIFPLARELQIPADSRASLREAAAVVVQSGWSRFALGVDEAMAVDEVVIKPFGEFLRGVSFFSGATISGDGRVILILDPASFAGRRALASELPGSDLQPPARSAAGPRRSVLLVDDSLSVRKVIGNKLTRAGFHVTTANDGLQALEIVRQRTFDAIITDLEMPRLSGYELIEDLRRRPWTKSLPIFVITTRAGRKHLDLARQLGATSYFSKPIDEEALIAQLNASMAPQAALSEPM